jgi:hypothetical protein
MWSPYQIFNDLEWWELLGIWNVILKKYETKNEIKKPVKRTASGGTVENILIDAWRRPPTISDRARQTRDRILRGEI